MNYERILNLKELLNKKSHFLFGARATGKSTLIKQQLPNAKIIDLLRSDLYYRLLESPALFQEMLPENKNTIVVVDEIQRIPELLNVCHLEIEKNKRRFLLTGSSARKLKSGKANLLAARAWEASLYPLVTHELGAKFQLPKLLLYGSLPSIYDSKYPTEELRAYVHTYLYEEIQAESIVRKIPQFSSFLKTASLSFGEIINYTSLSSQCGVPASTLKEHFKILEDTLLGFTLEPWKRGKSRKSIQSAKFYFFDNGITNTLAGTKAIDKNTDLWGKLFEQFLINEIKAHASYTRLFYPLHFWRTQSHDEVDLIINDDIAIEFKSTNKIQSKHLHGLIKIQEEAKFKHLFLVSTDKIERTSSGIQCLYYKNFLEKLWSGEIIS
jgi:predicted AAA+ superfamily ATPase